MLTKRIVKETGKFATKRQKYLPMVDVSKPVSVSASNSKTGNILSFSLPPKITCPNSKQCFSICYAVGMYNNESQKNTPIAWERNLEIIEGDPERAIQELSKVIQSKINGSKRTKREVLFRIHVSGDFYSQAYLELWRQLALKYPDVLFYTYTKMYYYFKNFDMPFNFKCLASFMESIPLEHAFKISDDVGLKMAYAMRIEEFKKLDKEVRSQFFVCPEITTKQVIKKNYKRWGYDKFQDAVKDKMKVNCRTCRACFDESVTSRHILLPTH